MSLVRVQQGVLLASTYQKEREKAAAILAEVIRHMQPHLSSRMAVGIDPGNHTGVCLYSRIEREVRALLTLTFWDAYLLTTTLFANHTSTTQVVLEQPSRNKPTFVKKGINPDELRKRDKLSQNVGGNKKEADLLAAGLYRVGFSIEEVRPTRKKWDQRTVKVYTGLTISTNEHTRDALRLVWGM